MSNYSVIVRVSRNDMIGAMAMMSLLWQEKLPREIVIYLDTTKFDPWFLQAARLSGVKPVIVAASKPFRLGKSLLEPVQYCTEQFVMVADDDILYMKDWGRKLSEFISSSNEPLVMGSLLSVKDNWMILPYVEEFPPKDSKNLYGELVVRAKVSAALMMVKREVLLRGDIAEYFSSLEEKYLVGEEAILDELVVPKGGYVLLNTKAYSMNGWVWDKAPVSIWTRVDSNKALAEEFRRKIERRNVC